MDHTYEDETLTDDQFYVKWNGQETAHLDYHYAQYITNRLERIIEFNALEDGPNGYAS
jgi:hypothetical protein